MSERKPAPGRLPDVVAARWNVGWVPLLNARCRHCREMLPSELTIAAAADALRDHLRAEHADLWESCPRCYDPTRPNRRCSRCHGRGYIERSES